MSLDHDLLRIALRRHGILTSSDLHEAGASRSRIRALERQGVVNRVGRGAYLLRAMPSSPSQSAALACALTHQSAVTSHRTAVWVWGLSDWHPPLMDVVVRHGLRTSSPRAVHCHRTRWLPDEDRCEHDGIPVTSPSRTLVDVARYLPDERLAGHIAEALRRDLVAFEILERRLSELAIQGRNGIVRFREVLENLGPIGDSELERRTIALLRNAGLPAPVLQHPVTIGSTRYRLDLAWPDRMLAVECQGWLHHHTPEKSHSDADRHNRLVGAGWTVVYATWKRVTTEGWQVVADVRRHLGGP